MVDKIRQIRAKWRERRRQQLLALIGRDIENIAHDAYREGCYVTERRMQAEKLIEFQHLMATNEALRERMLDLARTQMPNMVFTAKAP